MSLPFFKYAGGKRRLVGEILPRLRLAEATTYVEPFVGGGAVFLAVRAAGFSGPAILNDANPRVIATWRAVQVDPASVIAGFRAHAASDSGVYYYGLRKCPPAGDVPLAAWFLYLNKAGFNGLYRVNSRGEFNVPYGDGKAVTLDEEAVWEASEALRGTDIRCGDFANVVCSPGVACYCDPPYLALNATSSFTAYTRGGFGPGDQLRLAAWARAQANAGSRVVLSNAGNDDALTAFAQRADRATPIQASRVISCKGAGRQPVREYLFEFYPEEA